MTILSRNGNLLDTTTFEGNPLLGYRFRSQYVADARRNIALLGESEHTAGVFFGVPANLLLGNSRTNIHGVTLIGHSSDPRCAHWGRLDALADADTAALARMGYATVGAEDRYVTVHGRYLAPAEEPGGVMYRTIGDKPIHVGDWITWGTRTMLCKVSRLHENIGLIDFSEGINIVTGQQETVSTRVEPHSPIDSWPDLTSALLRLGWAKVETPAQPQPEVAPDPEPEPTAEPKPDVSPEVEALRGQITHLEGRISDLNNEVAKARRQHGADIDRIGDRLMEEADRRSWCSEYDEIVDSLNSDLHFTLPTREREYDVVMDVTVRVRMTVTASNGDSAWDAAREMFDDSPGDHVRYGDIEDVEQYDVSEA